MLVYLGVLFIVFSLLFYRLRIRAVRKRDSRKIDLLNRTKFLRDLADKQKIFKS
jgi:hypothetical protein